MRAERLVFDTNVLIAAALAPGGLPNAVLEALMNRQGRLLFSEPTYEELRSRLLRVKFDRWLSRGGRKVFLSRIKEASHFVWISGAPMGCRDPDDDKVLETALMGDAECVVTGDNDLLVMSPFRGIPILTPAEFLSA